MRLVDQSYLLLIFLTLTATSTLAQKYARYGCQDMCGDVRIPYPFGIGPSCSVNEWYTVDCNSSMPYLSALHNLEVLDINLKNQTVTVNVSMISDCQNLVRNSTQILNVDLGNSPYLFSRVHNTFVVEGCGNAVILDHGSAVTGCSSTCGNGTVGDDKDKCLGVSCCQTVIPNYLKSYSIDLTGLERQGGDGACGSAFLVDKSSYDEGRFSRQSVAGDNSYVPISLMWTLSNHDSVKLMCCNGREVRVKLDLGNGTSVESWKCRITLPLEGNPYLNDGCVVTEECSRCRANNSYCDYHEIYDDHDRVSEWNITCSPDQFTLLGSKSRSSVGVILGVTISFGVLFLVGSSFSLFKVIKKTKARRQRKRFFKRNGGLLLKQQEEADPSLVDKTILFTSRELEKATDSFNENRILGRGGQGKGCWWTEGL